MLGAFLGYALIICFLSFFMSLDLVSFPRPLTAKEEREVPGATSKMEIWKPEAS